MKLNRGFKYPQGIEFVRIKMEEIVWKNSAIKVGRLSEEEIAIALEKAKGIKEKTEMVVDNW